MLANVCDGAWNYLAAKFEYWYFYAELEMNQSLNVLLQNFLVFLAKQALLCYFGFEILVLNTEVGWMSTVIKSTSGRCVIWLFAESFIAISGTFHTMWWMITVMAVWPYCSSMSTGAGIFLHKKVLLINLLKCKVSVL